LVHTLRDDKGHFIIVASIDCTGHGVPGAFMSLIGNKALNEIVNERKVTDPAKILDQLNHNIQTTLKQHQTNNNDGMDVCLCKLEFGAKGMVNLTFAGAKNPLYYSDQTKEGIQVIKGSRKSIGGFRSMKSSVIFENKKLTLQKGDCIYLTTDGLIDQNNTKRKKFGTIKLMDILNNIKSMDMADQREMLEGALEIHMDSEDQRDDITFWGIKF